MVCTGDEDVPAKVKEITGGKGAYAALDSVAGEMTNTCGQAVRDFGTVMVYGAMSGIEVSPLYFRVKASILLSHEDLQKLLLVLSCAYDKELFV